MVSSDSCSDSWSSSGWLAYLDATTEPIIWPLTLSSCCFFQQKWKAETRPVSWSGDENIRGAFRQLGSNARRTASRKQRAIYNVHQTGTDHNPLISGTVASQIDELRINNNLWQAVLSVLIMININMYMIPWQAWEQSGLMMISSESRIDTR